MKINKLLSTGFVFLTCILCANPLNAATAKIDVKVVDENGASIESASLKVRFSSNKYPVKSQTDTHGSVIIKSDSSDGVILGEVSKDGFYISGFHHDFFTKNIFGRWQPWPKEISVVMRPIINPVPMYVRNNYFEVPALGKEIGFDLEKSDWVIPYGLGVSADFVFRMERRYVSVDDFDASMVLTFSNPLDGIQVIKDDGGGVFNTGSRFRLPRIAPLGGYQPRMEKIKSTSSPDFYSHNNEDVNYLFRVRSEMDADGNLVKAMYGKIKGGIEPDARGTKTVDFHLYYYLNPDYTQNLEFDPTRNLSIVSDRERFEKP